MKEKTLDVTCMEELKEKVSDVKVHGNPGVWKCICKAWSEEEGWMKSTKAMEVDTGVLVQVSTQQGSHVAEALAFIPHAQILTNEEGQYEIY